MEVARNLGQITGAEAIVNHRSEQRTEVEFSWGSPETDTYPGHQRRGRSAPAT